MADNVVNQRLRNGETISSEYGYALYSALKELFRNVKPLDKDIKVYRAIVRDDEFDLPHEGTIFMDKGFVSTSQTYDAHKTIMDYPNSAGKNKV